MSFSWIAFTLLAAFSQSWRNAFQSKLSGTMSVAGVTLARFIWAGPIALIYLCALYQWQPVAVPSFSGKFGFFIVAAAIMQILATGLMVMLFKLENYAIGAGLAKCEAPVSAVLSVLFFGTALTVTGWIGVLIGTLGVLIMSSSSGWRSLSPKVFLLGMACSTAFALTSLWVREASLSIGLPFPHSAAWVLFLVISLQTVIICTYLFFRERDTLRQIFTKSKLVVMTSLASVIGSLGWFSAMSLQAVPYVKTLGQIEVVFMVLISYFWLGQSIARKDILALILLSIAAVLVMWQ
ncbi:MULTISPECIES: DMT family transporter [Vibrio]|uniref:Multidrug transporter n=3 Tax=Vibrio cyclitrophicus TaxID=47951 RepID=A0A7Z1S027_9VIBR|nr:MULTISPECIES: DMT family transporter [Vibrio]ERM58150.1 Permeases of the drug/metabolite transporter (DMT) superfamily [Vibrio cyclitrophicus FF75]KAA8602565.1 Permease of the drug/metabolite transporter (DMT) superfamily [Vibrio cyclitrophicus]MBE8558091.1 DMT family transporter [Vibrio sp. OPT24]MBE8604344.1 DMT family transporter [Vibrio sp. OPT10]MBU2932111.1 DMT family transporter [Vibrio cyclitrophicus]|tara:strand:- start:1971 stop:2852 length:882 start_codon:yes stop_codon:yes gene_type:complete